MASVANAAHGAQWPDKRRLALAELACVVALVAGDYYDLVPISSTPFLLGIASITLRLRGLGWRDLGLVRPRSWPQALALGTVAGIAMELSSTFVSVPFLSRLAGKPPDLSDFRPLVGNLELLLVLQVPNWLLAAFGEEMGYRGYLMSRIAGLGQGRRGAWLLSLVVASALFGWGHGSQGLTGMLQEGLAGSLLGLLYLGCGRNLTIPIIAHGVSNTVAFLLIFFDRYPGV